MIFPPQYAMNYQPCSCWCSKSPAGRRRRFRATDLPVFGIAETVAASLIEPSHDSLVSRGAEDPPYRHVPVLHTFGASVGSRPCTVGRSLRNSKEIRMSFLFYLAITSALPLMIFFILMNTHRFGPTTAADSASCARRACLVRPPFGPSEGHRLIPRLSTHPRGSHESAP